MSKIRVIEKWERSEELEKDRLLFKYPNILEDKGASNGATNEVKRKIATIAPKDQVEIVSSFRGWLDYLKLPKCHSCNSITEEDYICSFCEQYYCDKCSAKVTQYNNPEKNCCLTCQENSKFY